MEDLRLPKGKIPQDKPEKLSMDQYLEFVLFNRKNFPQGGRDRAAPVPVRFVIRDDGDEYSTPKKQ